MLVPIDRPIIDARNIAEAEQVTVSSTNFTIQHNNKAVALITLGGSFQSYVSDTTTAIADGVVDGQELTLVFKDLGFYNDITIKDNANTALRGDWYRTVTETWLKVVWDSAASQWIETIRDEGVGSAAGERSHVEGSGTTASGRFSHAEGYNTIASGSYSHAEGKNTTASGVSSHAEGQDSIASLTGQYAHAGSKFSAAGDAQYSRFLMKGSTTDNTLTELTSPGRFTIDDEFSSACTVSVVARQDTGADSALFKRMVLIERTGGTVALQGAVQTIGTDINPGSLGGVTLSADDTNKSLKVQVQGAAAHNIRWVVVVEAVRVGYSD
ncbi:MAG: hypothetical protein GWP14_08865 [Actinobacteria bacterium]|nr:hypothetical protein [Actinomycetota bacterium]